MSGIYGIHYPLNDGDNLKEDILKLYSWNKAYGTQHNSLELPNSYMGCLNERLSDSSPLSPGVIHHSNKYAVIDAVLYNRKELIQEGDFSPSLSDEELLFYYIEKFGLSSLKNINGDFCGAIYDSNKNCFTLFRDHMGIRPLYYYRTEHILAFSTDLRGLTSMECVDVSINEQWLYSTILRMVNINNENTEFANIHCVKPASYIQFHCANHLQSTSTTYWEVGSKKIRLSTEAEYIKRLRELITDSIARRLNAISGIVGGELSGGLDSSIIDILIHQLGRDAIYFSWSASPEQIPYAEDDERLIIQDICKQENITCHYNDLSTKLDENSIIYKKTQNVGLTIDMRAGIFRRYVLPPFINTTQICDTSEYIAQNGAKAIFTGHSGDEGVSHRGNPYELFYHKEYLHYFYYMWESTKGINHRLYNTFLRCRQNLTVSRNKLRNTYVQFNTTTNLLKDSFYNKYKSKQKIPLTFAYDPLTYVRNGGSRNRLDVIALLGAYCGTRYIVPYLDYRVIDFALSIPRHMYLKHQTHRYIFREAFKDIMPQSLYSLTNKEDTSWRNSKKQPMNDSEYLARKQRIYSMLDKDFWTPYLNLDEFERWTTVPLDSSNETTDFSMFSALDNCLSFQNLIHFSRSIKPITES